VIYSNNLKTVFQSGIEIIKIRKNLAKPIFQPRPNGFDVVKLRAVR